MNPFDKPTPQQDFYNNYFVPTQQELGGPMPVVLERALEKYPLQIRMSIQTLHRIRAQKER